MGSRLIIFFSFLQCFDTTTSDHKLNTSDLGSGPATTTSDHKQNTTELGSGPDTTTSDYNVNTSDLGSGPNTTPSDHNLNTTDIIKSPHEYKDIKIRQQPITNDSRPGKH